ncbi:hypothetical protein A9Q89_09575 [Gammaproteobacteria bacterium 53_120_T64]|nr:hypothetical protein A9Q89_09575 [Gammaproteobacteria bacterium 53_120_T64]
MSLGLLEDAFSALDALPDALYDVVITHTHGSLLTRARGIMQWREKLLAGQLPEMDELCWPEETIRKTLLMRIETLELPGFCQGQESLTDSVLQDICEGITSAEDYLAKTANQFNDKLAQRQKISAKDSSFRDEEGLADHVESPTPDTTPEDRAPSSKQAQHKAEQNPSQNSKPPATTPTHIQQAGAADKVNGQQAPSPQTPRTGEQRKQQVSAGEEAVKQQWQDLSNSWQQLADIDHQIERANKHQKQSAQLALTTEERAGVKSLPGRGWDLSTGLLRSQGWRDIIRYRQRIKALPELIRFIDAIGREEKIIGSDKRATVDNKPQALLQSRALGEGERSDEVPRKALEMDGIERGDDISRMLPSEMALLCHPVLKTLWHAKRAERLLLLYQHQGKRGRGQKDDGALEKKGSLNEQGRKGKSRLGRGPIIICLDTSGSMHGEPEHIAKAAVLETLKVAHREQRPCHLFAFSGPQQTTFHQLDLRRGGLIELLQFLQLSFHGGTDLLPALRLALEKQTEEVWAKADILLVTDGRIPLEKAAIRDIVQDKQIRGLRVFGILTGNWQQAGIQALCNDTLRIRY